MKKIALALCVTVVGALGAAADTTPSASSDDQRCVIARTIKGWSRIDDRTILLRARGNKYRVTFSHPCRDTNWAYSVRTDHWGMCLRPGDVLVFNTDSHPLGHRWHQWHADWPDRGFQERCVIKSIELLPPTP